MDCQETETVVEARRHPDTARDEEHSETERVNEGAIESIKTEREEVFEMLSAASCAEKFTVLVPCPSPESVRVQLPALSVVVVALEKLFEMTEDASAVPEKVAEVEVETAPSDDGAVMTGADGAVVSVDASDAAGAGPPPPAIGTPAEVLTDFCIGFGAGFAATGTGFPSESVFGETAVDGFGSFPRKACPGPDRGRESSEEGASGFRVKPGMGVGLVVRRLFTTLIVSCEGVRAVG